MLYFKSEFGLSAVQAGDYAALCTFAGALSRPIGGAVADRVGGIKALTLFYALSATALVITAFTHVLAANVLLFLVISAALICCSSTVMPSCARPTGGTTTARTSMCSTGFLGRATMFLRSLDGEAVGI